MNQEASYYTPHTYWCGPPMNDSYKQGALLELFWPVGATGCNQCRYSPFTGGPHQHVWAVYMMPIIASQIGHFNTEYILYFAKGKPSGPGSAYASAFFHPRCICKSMNVV